MPRRTPRAARPRASTRRRAAPAEATAVEPMTPSDTTVAYNYETGEFQWSSTDGVELSAAAPGPMEVITEPPPSDPTWANVISATDCNCDFCQQQRAQEYTRIEPVLDTTVGFTPPASASDTPVEQQRESDAEGEEEGPHECPSCGGEVDEAGNLCDDCGTCHDCGDYIDSMSDSYAVVDDEWVCHRCLRRNYSQCRDCDEWENDDCRSGSDVGGDYVCESCLSRNYWWCDNCDTYHADGDEDCVDQDGRGGNGIVREYGWHPHTFIHQRFHRENRYDDSELYGIELEVGTRGYRQTRGRPEYPADFIHQVMNQSGIEFYLTEDGSITECRGIEIVLHPMSRLFIDKNRVRIARTLITLSKAGIDSHNNGLCGLHIHINKKAFETTSHSYKFASMFVENKEFWYKSSRRTGNSWNQWCNGLAGKKKNALRWSKGDYNPLHSGDDEEYVSNGHYHGINMSPRHTIEVRVFRGTLNPLSFFGALEMVRATYDYSKLCGYEDTREEPFLKFLNDNERKYINALNYLATRRIIPARRSPRSIEQTAQLVREA